MTEALSKLNFRDIGSLPTHDGRIVRPGLIYRSEGPASFAPVHREELAALSIPVIELHLSNPAAREAFRHHSYVSSAATGVIAGYTLKLGENARQGRLRCHPGGDPSRIGRGAAAKRRWLCVQHGHFLHRASGWGVLPDTQR